jgi:hypothetical protein
MANEPAEDRRKKSQREPRRDSRSTEPQSEPISPPLTIDGPESIRDSHC